MPRDQDAKDSAFFAVYGKWSEGYQLSNFLAADVDLPGHVNVEVPGTAGSKYLVPRSCAECHGHSNSADLKSRPLDAMERPTDDFKTAASLSGN